ncbi:MAG: hypothetical protein GXO39_09985 [Thermotogae bacterium]|nr:hypothetical protein [Thermotogota bacterium]
MTFCKFFGECPVCKFQHLTYEDSLKRKAERIVDVLNTDVEVIPSPKDRAYKSRVILHVRRPAPNNLIMGYTLERGFVYGVDSCSILEDNLSDVIRPLNRVLTPAALSVWDAHRGRGKWQSITLVGDEGGITLSLNLRKPVFVKELTFRIMDEIPQITGVWWSVGNFGERLLGGRGDLLRTVRRGRFVFKVGPYGEYPDNLYILPKIWKVMEENLRGKGVAFLTGLYVPPKKMSVYVDPRGMVAREVMETGKVTGITPRFEYREPGAFLLLNDEIYDYVVIHTDRVRDRRVLEVGRKAVLLGKNPLKLKEFLSGEIPKRLLLFDVSPYTAESLVVAYLG